MHCVFVVKMKRAKKNVGKAKQKDCHPLSQTQTLLQYGTTPLFQQPNITPPTHNPFKDL